MAFYKNQTNSVTILAIDTGNSNAPKTGDALNITCQIVLDSGSPAATTDTNPTEINSGSMPGLYRFDLTAAECNADHIVLKPSSSTGSIEIDPVMIFTTDQSEFKADVSSLATTSALSTVEGKVDTIDGIVDSILIDTNDLQTNQGAWLTATGFSTHSAADVYTQFTSGSNEDVFKADVSALASQSSVDTIDGIVDSILVDTNDLQTNQGSWLTATGFSTHSAADVYTEFTNSNNEDVFKADVSSLATSSALSGVETKIDTIDTNVDSVLVDTNDLQANQGAWLTATGFSTHSAADVYTQFTTGANEDVFKADVSSLATSSALSTVSTNVSTIITTGSTGPWTTGSGGGGTSGPYAYSNTITNNGSPVDGATAYITAVGTTGPSLGQDITNALGEFTLQANTEGPFDVHIFKAGNYDDQTFSNITFPEV